MAARATTPAPAAARTSALRRDPADGLAHHTDRAVSASTTGTTASALIFVARAAPRATPASGTYHRGRRRARHSSQTDASTNPAPGTSKVASEP